VTITPDRPFVLVMNNERPHSPRRPLAGALFLLLAAAPAGCGLPPDVADNTPDPIQDFAFRCGPDRYWELVVRQEWKCADGEIRVYTCVRRVATPCEESLARDGSGPQG
jgi:hypothetical protein